MPYLLQVFLLVIAGGVSPTLIARSILWVLMVGKAAIPELVRDLLSAIGFVPVPGPTFRRGSCGLDLSKTEPVRPFKRLESENRVGLRSS